MKLAFFGTPEISAYVLDYLYEREFDIKWVVTQPDRPSGRGRKLCAPPVKVKANELNLPVFQTEKFDRIFFEELKKLEKIDIAVVIAYGQYIPSYFLNYPAYGCVNIHMSHLPKYRGAAPVARAIMNKDKRTGVSLIKLVKEMDAGDIIAIHEERILLEDTSESLTWRLTRHGAALLDKVLFDYVEGDVMAYSQGSLGVEPSYADKITKDDAIFSWSEGSLNLHNKVRALYPWPGIHACLNGLMIKLIKTRPVEMLDESLSNLWENDPPGTIIDINSKKNYILVKTGDTALLVEKVQPSGKREMSVLDFVNGHKLKTGVRFENVEISPVHTICKFCKS